MAAATCVSTCCPALSINEEPHARLLRVTARTLERLRHHVTITRTREESGSFLLPSLVSTAPFLPITNPGCKQQDKQPPSILPTAEQICITLTRWKTGPPFSPRPSSVSPLLAPVPSARGGIQQQPSHCILIP